MTDYVSPKELLQDAVQLAKRKSELPARDMLIRGILAGAFLGYATSLVFMVSSQGLAPIVGAILFPVGFVMLVLLGLELVTGNFALLPAGVMAGTVRVTRLLRSWGWVYLGNLIGSVLYDCGSSEASGAEENIGVHDAGLERLGHRAGEGCSLQLDGNHRCRAGLGLQVDGRENRCHVASDHDVLRARL